MVIKCIRARTYGKYITLIKAGTIFNFRNFFQKLSEFRQLTKTEDAYIYMYKNKNIDFYLYCIYLFNQTMRMFYIELYKQYITIFMYK